MGAAGAVGPAGQATWSTTVAVDIQRIVNGVLYILRSGCAWRYPPANSPPWQTAFYHFRRFRLQGKWHLLYVALHRAERECTGRHPEPGAAIMDCQSVKTVEESAPVRGMTHINV